MGYSAQVKQFLQSGQPEDMLDFAAAHPYARLYCTEVDALLDRLVHNTYRVVMKRESLRRKNTEEEAAS